MADTFLTHDCSRLLSKKRIVFIGDSNMRALYKDFVCLLTRNTLISIADLRRKCEPSHCGDRLVRCSSKQDQGRAFFEIRQFKKYDHNLEFIFVTRCINSNIEKFLEDCAANPESAPDAIVMNSCLWDISRWGSNGVPEYRDNLIKLMQKLNKSLPAKTLFIWTTTLPLSQAVKGGFLVKQVEFLKYTIRFDLMEANVCAHQHVVSHGYDVLDFHYFFRMQTHRRAEDGIHWSPEPIRFMTNLLLTHISLSWGKPLPGRAKGVALENIINNQTRFEPIAPSLKLHPQGVDINPLTELRNLQLAVESGGTGSQDIGTRVGKITSEQQHTGIHDNAVASSSQFPKEDPKTGRKPAKVNTSKMSQQQQHKQQEKSKKNTPRYRGKAHHQHNSGQNDHDNRNRNPYYVGATNFNENRYGEIVYADYNNLFMAAKRRDENYHQMGYPRYAGRFRPYPQY